MFKAIWFFLSLIGWTALFYTLGETLGDGSYLSFGCTALGLAAFTYYFSVTGDFNGKL